VNTGAARYQRLSLNPQKLAGQCGRLKCCLNYELEAYRSAIKVFPKTEIKLYTEKGIGVFQKMDIFKGLIWYAYKEDWMTWHKLTLSAVNDIIKKNIAKLKVPSLEAYVEEEVKEGIKIFDSGAGEDSLKRFDPPRRHSKKNKKKRFESKAKK